MELKQLIKDRYSCRDFSDKPVDDSLLKEILELSLLAPSAMNLQPYRIYVLKSKEELEKVDSVTRCRYGAPIVLLFTVHEDEQWHSRYQEGIVSGVEDVSILATHVMLVAKDYGLDTCWVNAYPNAQFDSMLSIPKKEKGILLMPIGYASDKSEASPRHNQKRPYSEIVKNI